MDDLAEVCVDEYVRNRVGRGQYDIVGPVWARDITDGEGDLASALVTGSHAIDVETVKRWKQQFPKLSMLAFAFTGIDRVKGKEIWDEYPELAM